MRIPSFLRRESDERERGATLILVAASMVAFIGMAGLAVDLGWIYLQSSNVKKATEAAALAAVIHMPLAVPQPAGTVILSGLPASDAAEAIALEHGFSAGATTASRWAKATQVRVDISSSTNTFFMAFFGIDTVSLKRFSVAEQLPPLKLGGDGDRLGTWYLDGGTLMDDEFYWLGINGETRQKEDGDPFSTRCDVSGCSGVQNPQYRTPAYYYAVDVPAADVGNSLTLWVYDGSNNNTAPDHPDDLSSGGTDTFTFSLIEPDSTPGDPTDNRANAGGATICSQSFANDDGSNVWTLSCSFTPAKQGIHVLEVSVGGNDRAINGFALRIDGGSGNAAIYGLGYMSLWMRDAGSSPELQIVRLDEVYAGTQLVVSAFDLGDITGNAQGALTFTGAFSGMDCRVRVWNTDMSNDPPPAWRSDNSAGGPPCDLVTKSGSSGGNQGIYNNEWVEFLFDVPAGYTCPASGCWGKVTYNFTGGSPTDRTTWGARINGTPLHLLNENTPVP